MEIDRSRIGEMSEPVTIDVEKGAIRKFAQSIGETSPLYLDEDFARSLGYRSVVAPPTFPTCFAPRIRLPWFDCLDTRRMLATGMTFDYTSPIEAGMRLVCQIRFVGVEDKEGRSGRMELMRHEMKGHDASSGHLVFTSLRSGIYRSTDHLGKESPAR